ncbi:hypothetical protein DL89DRAFT_260705 [Linderina pennispora]|uniref:Uncharacterized protein n=1 Tax=Linderina pennispora TaxID=61395 RepID=A0A1Y1VX50_9FUNG|nr:uncharacterized protein DL89DRAFT_260705 [Linderina pennispora]ORX65852.1 hypothetical protein DL89DRAFT_260705 [Linderina pennispora]
MYSSTGSAEQSRESVNASYDVLNSRLMPRAGNTADEELVFRSDSRSSKTSQNQQYMNTLSTGQKARNTLNASQTRVNSPGASTTSVNQQHTGQPRSQSSTGHYPSGPKPGRLPSRASSGAPGHPGGTANSSGSSEDSMKQKQMNHQRGRGGGSAAGASMMAKRRDATVDARGFLRTLNDLFFSKFCVDELFYREFREQLVKRIQESTYRYDPEDLQDILDDVSEACKSTR